jgi:hypothetical protein
VRFGIFRKHFDGEKTTSKLDFYIWCPPFYRKDGAETIRLQQRRPPAIRLLLVGNIQQQQAITLLLVGKIQQQPVITQLLLGEILQQQATPLYLLGEIQQQPTTTSLLAGKIQQHQGRILLRVTLPPLHP